MSHYHDAISRIVMAGNTRFLREYGLRPHFFGAYEPVVQEVLDYEQKYGNVPPWDHLLRKFEDTDLEKYLEPEPKLGPDEDGPLADEIRGRYVQGKVADLSKEFKEKTWGKADPIAALDAYRSQLSELYAETFRLPRDILTTDKLFDYFNELGSQTFIPTGFDYLDEQFGGGIASSDYTVVLARPGTGKSFTMIRMALTAAQQFRSVLYFTLETLKEDTMLRFVAELDPTIDYQQLIKGRGDPAKVRKAMERLHDLPVRFIDMKDVGNPTPSAIQAGVERVKPSLVFVDQMSFLRDDEHAREIRLRFVNVSNAFSRMAKKLQVPIVLASQAKREAEGRMPTPQDVAESDSMFQDCDKFFAMFKDSDGLHMQVWKAKNTLFGGKVTYKPADSGGLWRWQEARPVDEF